jgi:general secretion pathway protein G
MVKLDHWAKRQAARVSCWVARILASRPVEARQRAQAGYSLMEVLIAVAIIATLAALVAPRLFGQLDSSRQAAALTQIRMVETALDTMRLDLGRYPSQDEGLGLLVAPSADAGANWNGPYMDGGLPQDPWGAPFQYEAGDDLSRRGRVYSFGADGTLGGEGLNADIEPQR